MPKSRSGPVKRKRGSIVGMLLNPIGEIAPRKGAGKWLDPVRVIGNEYGGPTGDWIDPVYYLDEGPHGLGKRKKGGKVSRKRGSKIMQGYKAGGKV